MAKFHFQRPTDGNGDHPQKPRVDKDGDLEVPRRRKKEFLLIEHSPSTVLQLVGLQVWRGALLVNDYIIHHRERFAGKNFLELGSGVGLTSIVAALYCDHVTCTDLNVGGLLELIRENVRLNNHLLGGKKVSVRELDFMERNWTEEMKKLVKETDFVVAADVIYDDKITEAFLATLQTLFEHAKPSVEVLVALEKRFVFTLADMDSVAPSFEHFKRIFDKTLRSRLTLDFVPIDFAQYFEYDRVKQLVLMRITRK